MFRLIFILPNIRLYFLDNIGFFTIDKASSRLGNNAVTSKVLLMTGMAVDNALGMVVVDNDTDPFAMQALASALVVIDSHMIVLHSHMICPCSCQASY